MRRMGERGSVCWPFGRPPIHGQQYCRLLDLLGFLDFVVDFVANKSSPDASPKVVEGHDDDLQKAAKHTGEPFVA
jgi:hypothetical protein